MNINSASHTPASLIKAQQDFGKHRGPRVSTPGSTYSLPSISPNPQVEHLASALQATMMTNFSRS